MEKIMEGKTIAITRSEEDSEEFIELVSKENARPIPLPTIQLVSKGDKIVDEFLESIQQYNPDFLVFMSSKAVKLLFDTAKNNSKYEVLQLAVANTIVIAVGPKTKTALENEGIKVAYVPKRYSSVGVGEVLTRLNAVGKKVLVPRSGASTAFLRNLLEKIGLSVKEIYLYDVRSSDDVTSWKEFSELFSQNKIDGIVFTSASSVRAFFDILKKNYDEKTLLNNLEKTKVVSIGPFTAEELLKFNVKNSIATVHTVSGAFQTIKKIFSLA
jgi:uroporphyrinogen-III synthase